MRALRHISLSQITWPRDPAPPSPAMDLARAALRRAGRISAHRAIVATARAMLADAAEFNRIEPCLSDMPPHDRAEHCRKLWRACRAERHAGDPLFGSTDATNVRAACVASWIVERRERREETQTQEAA